MRTTHTYVELEVSAGFYEEVKAKLLAAGYNHAFMPDGAIDMHGIALVCAPVTLLCIVPDCENAAVAAGYCLACGQKRNDLSAESQKIIGDLSARFAAIDAMTPEELMRDRAPFCRIDEGTKR